MPQRILNANGLDVNEDHVICSGGHLTGIQTFLFLNFPRLFVLLELEEGFLSVIILVEPYANDTHTILASRY